MNKTPHSEDFKAINDALDIMEIERLSLGFWRLYAQMLLPRVEPEFARELCVRLIAAIKEGAQDRELRNQAHIQDALIDFEHEVKSSILNR